VDTVTPFRDLSRYILWKFFGNILVDNGGYMGYGEGQ
jgi:hypothetical protein